VPPSGTENFLHFDCACPNLGVMKQPVILLVYDKMLPGSQLVNRLQDLGYEVQVVPDYTQLVTEAQRLTPLLALIDLALRQEELCALITQLRKNDATSHLPVIALTTSTDTKTHQTVLDAGATLVVNDTAILLHLKQFLERALQVE
jgi:DNA-binding response OmpR family regulator